MWTDEEIERRLPVWMALSDLFLDTEIDDAWRLEIVRVCRAAGYSNEQVEAIFFDEVAPVFYSNLLSMAGEWQSWPPAFVSERIRRRRTAQPGWGMRWFLRRFLRTTWGPVRARLEE